MSRQDACKASSRRFISREQLSTDKEFIEIDNVSYTIASRLIFNISLEVFNQVWMRINAMDYDALITAYTDDVIIKYDDEPEAEEATVDMSELVVEEVPAPVEETVEEEVTNESETEEVSADESAEESEEVQPEEEEVVEEKKQENHSAPKPQKYAKFKRKK
jgi:PREDICTED: hypothetical protein